MNKIRRYTMVILAFFWLAFGLTAAIASDQSSDGGVGADKGYKSVYTPLPQAGEYCITFSEWILGVELECPGMAGYRVLLIEDDARQSITLVKNGKQYPLNIWSKVTPSFSVLGEQIEWRVNIDKKIVDDAIQLKSGVLSPVALIVRVDSVGERKESNLAVVDLARENKCVVYVVPPGKGQNLTARRMADQAAELDCVADK